VKQRAPGDESTPESDAVRFLAQRWFWLGALMAGRREVNGVLVDGFSVRFDGVLWLVVVRGTRLEGLQRVVVFGRASRLYEALRNATSTIQKSGWTRDQYTRSP